MKKTLLLFRVRWLLAALLLVGALGAKAQDTWYLFDSYVDDGKPRATITNPDADGNYVFEFTPPADCRSNNFTFVNSLNPKTDQETAKFLGYSTSSNCNVTEPMKCNLVETSYDIAFGDRGSFVINDGDNWLVTFNPTAMTVEFAKVPIRAPQTLYLCDFTTTFGSATNNGDGIYEFVGVVPASSYPYYGFSPDADPKTSEWVLGTVDYETASSGGSHAHNVNVEFGTSYTWEFSKCDAINSEKGSFVLDEVSVNITLDWNAKTVVFTETPVPAPDNLWLVDFTNQFATAANDGNGHFEFKTVKVPENQYPYYGFANNANPRQADVVVAAVSDREANRNNNVNVEMGQEYSFAMSSYDYIDGMMGCYKIAPGIYDITLDWEAKTVRFDKAVIPAPDVLYFVDYHTSFGSATNNGDGIFEFEGVVPASDYPYYGFSPEENPTGAEWVLGTVDFETAMSGGSHAHNINVEFGTPYTWEFSQCDALNAEKGSFVLSKVAVNITLDWNNQTVTFTEKPIPAPDNLWLVDYNNQFATAANDGNGRYIFKAVSVPDNQYPYYGFANNANPRMADVVAAAVSGNQATRDNNVTVEKGQKYSFAMSSYDNIDGMKGCFVINPSTYDITLDWEAKTVRFDKTVIPAPSVLFATDTYLEDVIGNCSNDGTGVFSMVVNVEKSNCIVVFTNSTKLKNEDGETLYYGTEGDAVRNPEFGVEYGLTATNYNTVWGDGTGIRLVKGRYKMIVDFNEGTIVVHDISRGDVWTIPQTLGMYDDEMNLVAAAQKVEEGVFKFEGLALTEAVNVVFTDNATSTGKFFGSSMNGDRSVEVKNYRTYDLYIPKYQEIKIDGLAGFNLAPGKWDVTVDFNEKVATFVDPQAVYYPEEIDVVLNGAAKSNVAEGNGTYTWKISVDNESDLSFIDHLTGRTYGSPAAGVTVAVGKEYDASELAADALHAFKLPAGIWEAVLDLAKGKITFYEYKAIKLVDSTMKDGDKFYSYFGAGTNPNLTLTFSGNPYTVAKAFLALGSYVAGQTASTDSCTIENIDVYREGNTLFSNFGGKVRALPANAKQKVTLVLTQIKSVHGLLIDTDPIQGLPAGSLMFTFDFEEFQPIAIESKMLDADGKPVEKADTLNVDELAEITLLVKPYSLITFDGVELQPAEDNEAEAVALDWTAGEANADGFTPIVAKLPMAVRGTGAWTLTLANLNVDDNAEHGTEVSHAIVTEVHPADVVTADPADGSKVDELQNVKLAWTHKLVQSAGYAGATEPEVEVTNADGETFAATLQVLSTLADNELMIRLADRIVEAGTYTLVIPAGTIVLNDEMDTNAKALTLTYEVSGNQGGIDQILAADPDAETTVCTVSGIVLRHGRTADVLKDLREGIYIINGVKTHVVGK